MPSQARKQKKRIGAACENYSAAPLKLTTENTEQDIRTCQEEPRSDSPAGISAHTELRGGESSDDLTSSCTSDKITESGSETNDTK